MILVYVAGPFRAVNPDGSPDMFLVQEHVMTAMRLGLEVVKLGGFPIIPHANTMFFTGAAGLSDEVWLKGDLEMLRRCDAMILTSDWQRSSGATAEKHYAERMGIEVFRELRELDDWMRRHSEVLP